MSAAIGVIQGTQQSHWAQPIQGSRCESHRCGREVLAVCEILPLACVVQLLSLADCVAVAVVVVAS